MSVIKSLFIDVKGNDSSRMHVEVLKIVLSTASIFG